MRQILLPCSTSCSVDSLQGVDSPVGSPSFHTVPNSAAIGAHFAFGNVRRYVSPVGYIYYFCKELQVVMEELAWTSAIKSTVPINGKLTMRQNYRSLILNG